MLFHLRKLIVDDLINEVFEILDGFDLNSHREEFESI